MEQGRHATRAHLLRIIGGEPATSYARQIAEILIVMFDDNTGARADALRNLYEQLANRTDVMDSRTESLRELIGGVEAFALKLEKRVDGMIGSHNKASETRDELQMLTRRHEAAVDSLSARCRALEGTGDRTSSPARTSVVDVLNLCRDALVRITALEGGDITRSHGVRLDNLGADLTKAEGTIKNLRGTIEGMGMTLAEQNQRAIALHARVDALERGRTGRVFPPEDMEPILSSHAAKRHGLGFPRIGSPLTDDNKPPAELLVNGKPRAVVDRGGGMFSVQLQPEDLEGTRVVIGPAPERRGPPPGVPLDPTTLAIEGVRAELDGQRRRNTELTKERDDLNDRTRRLLERADATQRELEAERALVTRTTKERDESRRGYKCAVDERDALEKQRDEAVRQRDQYGDRNKAHSATTADQAAQIAELRATLKQREAEHSAALSRQASTWESDRREGAEQVRRLIEENQKLRAQSGTMWPKAERDKAMATMADLQLERDNAWRCLDHRVDGQPFYSERDRPLEMMISEVLAHYRGELASAREQLRVADGDRVPLAMDLENERADHKATKERCGRMEPLVKCAQEAANAWKHEPDPVACLSLPLQYDLERLEEAADAYETACSQAADEDDDGFANAAANEGARIAAESRAEAESDPGSVSG